MSRRLRRIRRITEGSMASDRHSWEYFGINRYLCSVLDDMRALDKSKNYSALAGLIEEAQVLGNRMEAGLADVGDLNKIREELGAAKAAYKKLKREYRALEREIEKLEKKRPKSKPEK